jgi:hypothetical protein
MHFHIHLLHRICLTYVEFSSNISLTWTGHAVDHAELWLIFTIVLNQLVSSELSLKSRVHQNWLQVK